MEKEDLKNQRLTEARDKFRKFRCGPSVLTTYKDYIDISEDEAIDIGRGMSGGRMIDCGAVLGAMYVAKAYGVKNGLDEDTAKEYSKKIRDEFVKNNNTSKCRELKTGGAGNIKPCTECVWDACDILESVIEEIDAAVENN